MDLVQKPTYSYERRISKLTSTQTPTLRCQKDSTIKQRENPFVTKAQHQHAQSYTMLFIQ